MALTKTGRVVAGIVIGSLISALGCGTQEPASRTTTSPPPQPIAKNKPTPPNEPPVNKGPPKADFTLTSKDFQTEFLKDKDGFKKKYEAKLVKLSGEIREAGRRYEGDFVGLEGESPYTWVVCQTRDKEPWKSVLPGQTVTVLGRVEVSAIELLRDCLILEKSGSGPAVLTADELGKEYKSSDMATERRYSGINLILKGEVARTEDKAFGFVLVFKTQAEEPVVFVEFNDWSKDMRSALTPGKEVVVVGRFESNLAHFADKKKTSVGVYAGGLLEKTP